MQPEAGNPRSYFDTPARAERLQLLQHLLRNVGEVIYLRAPAGAGKTRFAHRLLDILGTDIASVWIRGGIDTDIASVAIAQLGLNAGQSLNWPDGVLAGVGEKDLLIVVDDADQLDLPAMERLSEMHAHGGQVLLLGHGGLAQTTREWSVQYVDLPPFTVEQSSAFLRSNAGDEAVHINDDLAGFLHHSAHGRPGPLLDSLDEVLVRARRQAETRQRRRGKARNVWVWLGAAGVAMVLGAAVLFQDPINALFVSAPPAAPPTTAKPSAADFTASAPVPSPAQLAAEQPGFGRRPEPVPEIALPELSRPLPTAADPTKAPEGGEATATDAVADPLETVMRDAFSAAEDGKASPAVGAADRAASKVPAEPTSGRSSSAPAVETGSDTTAPAAVPSSDAATAAALAAKTRAVSSPTAGAATTKSPAPSRPSVAEVADELVDAAAPAVVAAADDVTPPAGPPAAVKPDDSPSLPIEPSVTAASEVDVEDAQSAVQPQREPAGPAPVVERSSKAATVDGRSAVEPRPTLPAGPAPVEERLPPTVAKAPPPVAVATAPKPPPVARRTAAAADAGGIAWLKSRRPERYTLQLVGARERAAVEKFVRRHRVERPYAIFERSLNGRPWYSLVAGDYPDRDAAIAARGGLPNSLRRSDIWPRTFASVHESLK